MDYNIKDFNKLETLNEKLNFWENSIGINYINFLEDFNEDSMYPFHQFKIQTDEENKQIWEPLNRWILENYESTCTESKSITLLNLKDLKNKFSKKLHKLVNEAEAINDELKFIDESFIKSPLKKSNIQNYNNHFYEANYEAYHDYLTYQKFPNYSNIYPGLHIIKHANGKTLAEYKNYLHGLLKKQINIRTKNSNEVLTTMQICLLLHYTGVLDALKDDITVKARLFSGLLNISRKNIYDKLREVNQINKSAKDLQAVLDFLLTNDLMVYSKQIKKDLIALDKKQYS